MEYFVISAKFVPLKYYTLSSQLRHLTSFSVGCSGRRILSPDQIAVMQKWSIGQWVKATLHSYICILIPLTSYVGLKKKKKCSTAVATTSLSTIEGALQLL